VAEAQRGDGRADHPARGGGPEGPRVRVLTATGAPVRVSAVTPVYNRAAYLAEALDSALAQAWDGLEVVVVDDGSTDATPDVLARYGDRIRTHRQPNAGQSAAWNRCLEMARGEYVAFLDSDDAWLPGKLARQVPLLDADRGAALLYAGVVYVDGKGAPLPNARGAKRTPSGEVLRDLLADNFMRTPTVIARREALLAAGGFRPELSHGNDWDMWLRIATRARVILDPVPSARYRLHGEQMVADRRKLAEARVRILEDHLPRIEREAPAHAGAARQVLGARLLKVAKLDLREGKREDAERRIARALEVAPGLRLRAWWLRRTVRPGS
jgi:glycosyltransferase involved in cell wall biosynthesis